MTVRRLHGKKQTAAFLRRRIRTAEPELRLKRGATGIVVSTELRRVRLPLRRRRRDASFRALFAKRRVRLEA